jgi:hypothetical protein
MWATLFFLPNNPVFWGKLLTQKALSNLSNRTLYHLHLGHSPRGHSYNSCHWRQRFLLHIQRTPRLAPRENTRAWERPWPWRNPHLLLLLRCFTNERNRRGSCLAHFSHCTKSQQRYLEIRNLLDVSSDRRIFGKCCGQKGASAFETSEVCRRGR